MIIKQSYKIVTTTLFAVLITMINSNNAANAAGRSMMGQENVDYLIENMNDNELRIAPIQPWHVKEVVQDVVEEISPCMSGSKTQSSQPTQIPLTCMSESKMHLITQMPPSSDVDYLIANMKDNALHIAPIQPWHVKE